MLLDSIRVTRTVYLGRMTEMTSDEETTPTELTRT